MSATNAQFWTDHGWDGSEDMIWKTQQFLTRVPSRRRIGFLSMSCAKTIVVTLQGLQALFFLFTVEGTILISISNAFFLLAMLGLMRLPAALWLTEDFSYADYNGDIEVLQIQTPTSAQLDPSLPETVPKTLINMGLLELPVSTADTMHSPRSWRGLLLRILFLLPLLSLWVVNVMAVISFTPTVNLTLSLLVINVFFHYLFTATLVICYSYIFQENSTTTIIPCISSLWYKMYTASLIVLVLVVILVTALETKKTPCGMYTTIPDKSLLWPCAWEIICRNFKTKSKEAKELRKNCSSRCL